TAIAMTQIRAALIALVKPSTEMEKLLKKVGFASGESMIQTLGFAGSMAALRDAADNNNQVLATAFGRVEGLNAALGVTGDNAEMAAADIDAMRNSAGAATDAFKEMDKSTSRQMDRLKSSLKDIAISVGTILLPTLNNFVEAIKPIITSIQNWIKEHPELTKSLILAAGAIGGLMLAIGPLLMILPGLATAIGMVGTAIGILAGPVGWIALAIAAIGALALAWKNNWGGIREKTEMVVEAIAKALGWLWDKMMTGFEWAFKVITGQFRALGFIMQHIPGLENWGNRLVKVIDKVDKEISDFKKRTTKALTDFDINLSKKVDMGKMAEQASDLDDAYGVMGETGKRAFDKIGDAAKKAGEATDEAAKATTGAIGAAGGMQTLGQLGGAFGGDRLRKLAAKASRMGFDVSHI
ncbi:hypothetical protein LCGC14_2795570, partial [marine sediment metagenome]